MARARIDADRPDPARVLCYWLGGSEHFAADRAAGDELAAILPRLRELAVLNRRFILSATRWLARNRDIGQFIDLGCGLPASPGVHDAAREVIAGACVAYVDVDPLVVSHVRADAGGPGLAVVEGDVRDPGGVLADPGLREVIDLKRPVGLVLGGVLSDMCVPQAREAVAGWAERVEPGSAFIVSCASITDPDVAARVMETFAPGGAWCNRRPQDIAGFFAAGWLRILNGAPMDIACWPLCPQGAEASPDVRVLGGIGFCG